MSGQGDVMSASGWRFTVTQKIMAGLAVIIVIGM